jgi:PAS domain S-box-containing protein
VLAGYVLSTLVLQDAPADAYFVDNLTMLGATAILTVVTTLVLERRRWREFAREWALATAHREARESAERYRSVVETAGSAIMVLAPDGRVLEFNREAERVLGWARERVIGEDLLAVCVPEGSRRMLASALAHASRRVPCATSRSAWRRRAAASASSPAIRAVSRTATASRSASSCPRRT